MTVSVEIEKDNTDDHPMTTKEVQVFTMDTVNIPETWIINVDNPTNGAYKIAFQDPDTFDFINS